MASPRQLNNLPHIRRRWWPFPPAEEASTTLPLFHACRGNAAGNRTKTEHRGSKKQFICPFRLSRDLTLPFGADFLEEYLQEDLASCFLLLFTSLGLSSSLSGQKDRQPLFQIRQPFSYLFKTMLRMDYFKLLYERN
jgi:hypothetical protein